MRYASLDFGSATIGVAISDPDGRVATGLTTLRRDAPDALRANIRELKDIIRTYGINALVLGYPKHMDNSLSLRCEITQAFKEKLERNFKKIPVTLWDERLSTQAVSRTFEGSAERYARHVDEMAAIYILQGFLDYKNNNSEVQMEQETNDKIVTMTDEDGNEIQYEILAAQKDENDVLYWLLAENADDEEEAEVFHFKCIMSDEDEMTFEWIDDEHEEFDKVMELFANDHKELDII